MAPGAAHSPTAVVRRAGWLSVLASVAVIVADVTFGRLMDQATGTGWTGDLFASPRSALIVLTPMLITPTVIRVLAHSGPTPMPVTAARATIAGVTAALGCAAIGVATVLGSVLAVPVVGGPAADAALWVVLALLAGGAAALMTGARSLHRARTVWTPAFSAHSTRPVASRPDLVDDLSTVIAHLLPGSVAARSGAWLNRRLDVWAWSPRRHRAGFVTAFAVIAAVMLTGWRAAASGPWSGPLAALAFAVLAGALVAAGLAAAITWLGLLRPQPR